MNAQSLFLADGTKIGAHLCCKCKRIWESEDSATRCCTCSFCGKHTHWDDSVVHHACQALHSAGMDAERLATATIVKDYRGPFLIKDRLYMEISDLFDHFTPEELPEFGFCCDEQPAYIDIGQVIENVADQMHEDWEEERCAALDAGIAEWNKANEGNGSWTESDDRKWSRSELIRIHGEANACGECFL